MYEMLLLVMLHRHELQAEYICATNTQVVLPLNPRVQDAITDVVKRKEYWHNYCFYPWGGHTDAYNVAYARQHYWNAGRLPPLSAIDSLPSPEFIAEQFLISFEYEKILLDLKKITPPWRDQDLQTLIEESHQIQRIWAQANKIQSRDNQLQCRIYLQELRDMLDGDESILWVLPPFPTWRFR